MRFDADEALVASTMQAGTQANSPIEEPSSTQTDPGGHSSASSTAQLENQADFREFDARHREPFTGLLYLGYLEDEFTLYGHRFTMCTPTQADRLQLGPVIKEYGDTSTGQIAYQCALVAAYLVSVDGQPIAVPIFTTEHSPSVRDKFTWVINNLRRPIIAEISDKCFELEDQVATILEAMGKASASPE